MPSPPAEKLIVLSILASTASPHTASPVRGTSSSCLKVGRLRTAKQCRVTTHSRQVIRDKTRPLSQQIMNLKCPAHDGGKRKRRKYCSNRNLFRGLKAWSCQIFTCSPPLTLPSLVRHMSTQFDLSSPSQDTV